MWISDSMEDLEEIKKKIEELEHKKNALIDEIKKLNERKKYKEYERRVIEPFVEKTKDVQVGYLKKQMRSLDFKISTQAFTPQKERLIIRELKKVEEEYAKVKEVERSRRKLVLVKQDIDEVDSKITGIDSSLKRIRDELKDLYGQKKMHFVAQSKGITMGKTDDTFSLEDLAGMEEN